MNFTSAITNYKALIDNFPSSSYIYTSLSDLYVCYRDLDTSSDQSIRDILYGDLKQYLLAKMDSDDYSKDFEDEAYLVILECETAIENYNDALTGYEFIALYHPDAEQRLMASWEYDHIEDLLGGGGGEKELGFEALEIEKRMQSLNEFIDRDPIMKQLKERYEKINKEKKALRMKEGYVSRINVNEDKLIERTKQNIYTGKNLTKDQKEKRFLEDMNLLLNPDNIQVGNDNSKNLLPTEYSLSQNYPNPFNPVTKINFDLPEDGTVKLVIYDILGREIIRLVNNELKVAGKYTMEFNGSNLASGIYFYRIEVGNPSTGSGQRFIQTKRMVLIK